MHHILTHFNSKSVNNLYLSLYFQCEKFTGNEIFPQLVHFSSLIHNDLPRRYNPRHLASIILNNFTKFHVHTTISFSVIPIL